MNFLAALADVMYALAPWLLLGAVIAGALHVLLPADFVRKHLRGRGGVAKAVALGVPLPLCSCGVIPAGLGLKKDGASTGAAVGFLISTPQTGVDSVLVSGSFLGWPFALFKLASSAITGLVGGWLADHWAEPNSESTDGPAAPTAPRDRSVRGAYDHAIEVLRSIWRWLVFGIVASALITTYLPPEWMGVVAGRGEFLALLLTLAISVPLYVCATASVPIAAALVAAGLPPGAALVFLMAGPATNVATLGAVYRTLGRRALAVYLGTIVFGSVGLAYVFDFVLPTTPIIAAHDHTSVGWPTLAAALFLSGMLAYFALGELRSWIRKRRPTSESTAAISLGVDGMTCNGCVNKLTRALVADPRITDARVSLESASVDVDGEVDRRSLAELVLAAGFTPAER